MGLIEKLASQNQIHVLGVMSGTSLDGLDFALVHFRREAVHSAWVFEMKQCKTIAYPEDLRQRLKAAIHFTEDKIGALNIELGEFIGDGIFKFIKEHELEVDLIASHGHTIFHQPHRGLTLQIGSGRDIAERTGIPVINNFRQADVQAGGQGAPLVPIGDRDLFSDYDLALNLGGIANISFDKNGKRLAFDICPFNMALNELAREIGLDYDEGGMVASKGMVEKNLLEELNEVPYLAKPFPKSLGLEDYLSHWQPLLKKWNFPLENKMATYSEHAAFQIAQIINQSGGRRVLVTGGGAYHDFFISLLKNFSLAEIVLPSKEIIEFKEALVFAYLGLLRLENKPNCLASVTGAKYNVCGGDLICL